MCRISRFLHDEEAATAVEYAVMLAMIILVALSAISVFGNRTASLWGAIRDAILGTGS
jgi:pilus assembly protein Flp/PilA